MPESARVINYDIFKKELCSKWLPQHYYPLCKLHDALHRIALKCFPVIPIRKIELCPNLECALQLLEKWKLLSYDRLTIIIEFSDLLQGPTDVIKAELLRLNPQCGSVSFCNCYVNNFVDPKSRNPRNLEHTRGTNGPIRHESVYSEVFDYLSENMGLRWIDFGRCLRGMRDRTEELRNDSSLRQKDKILTLLDEFESDCGEGNVLMQLFYYLNVCKMRRQSDEIKEKFAYLL